MKKRILDLMALKIPDKLNRSTIKGSTILSSQISQQQPQHLESLKTQFQTLAPIKENVTYETPKNVPIKKETVKFVQLSPKQEASIMNVDVHLIPDGGQITERIYDCCAYLIYCPLHDQLAVSYQLECDVVWLPFIPLPSNRSWNEGALYGSFLVLSGGVSDQFIELRDNMPYMEAFLVEVFRFQMPQTNEFVNRLVYYVRLNPNANNNNNFKCCQETDRLKWLKLEFINSGLVDNAWGPELVHFSKWIGLQTPQRIHSYSLTEAYRFVPHNPPHNIDEMMLQRANITHKDVERLYYDFIDHCFPSFSMTFCSFQYYMLKYDFERDHIRIRRLFKAFNINRNGYISFSELLLGLAAIEPNSVHGEARMKFVFRYYDHRNKGFLFEEDFRRMIRDLNPNDNETEIDRKVIEGASKFRLEVVGDKFGISYDEFYRLVTISDGFRGTSSLCRAKKEIFSLITRVNANRLLKQTQNDNGETNKLGTIVEKKFHKGTCQRCKELEWIILPNMLKQTYAKVTFDMKILKGLHVNKKRPIDHYLLEEHPAARLMAAIHQFAPNKGLMSNPNGILAKDIPRLMLMFQPVYDEMMRLLNTTEGKCVTVSSPCYIIGDIHGNLEDLLTLERTVWRSLPMCPNLLFLGDYVDRGKWSTECALYVFALKVLYPHRVTLLRGNHEIRDIQRKYSFYNECTNKFKSSGEKIWDMFNKVFDRLPIVGILDNTVYAAHGGIPHESTIEDIARLPLDIASPERCELVWEIVWSDPVHNNVFQQVCELLDENPNQTGGFVKNTKRGAAWFFNAEVCGFWFHFGDKCVTVFSCSHYCGNQNECAVLFANQELIRPIRIDTHNNAPATDDH
ncbi:hypothetical protein RDWZM_004349 [Blomia tropicalis]|uniref:Serine/threonine-protein phosphatase n=1 Tax=Blomia tropicalis TaxID=40697 RepID=A0A9Q0RTF3_BLOTA|nr:hypothetical protein RDWZM_004349 [Blomia tropicalis]